MLDIMVGLKNTNKLEYSHTVLLMCLFNLHYYTLIIFFFFNSLSVLISELVLCHLVFVRVTFCYHKVFLIHFGIFFLFVLVWFFNLVLISFPAFSSLPFRHFDMFLSPFLAFFQPFIIFPFVFPSYFSSWSPLCCFCFSFSLFLISFDPCFPVFTISLPFSSSSLSSFSSSFYSSVRPHLSPRCLDNCPI